MNQANNLSVQEKKKKEKKKEVGKNWMDGWMNSFPTTDFLMNFYASIVLSVLI